MFVLSKLQSVGVNSTSLVYTNKLVNDNVLIRNAQDHRPAALGRNKNSSKGAEEDVEIFSLGSGWNVEALSASENLLEDLGEWSVDSIDSDDEDDDAFIDQGDDDDEDGGDLAAFFGVLEEPATLLDTSESAPRKRGGKKQLPAAAAKAAGPGSAEKDLLSSLPKHLIRRLKEQQVEADEENEKVTPRELKKAAARAKTHKQLKIISGSASGRRLISPQGDQTRPMMEMVRGAVFSMITSIHGTAESIPETSRWLDLFAGTGAVGLEALSRGAREAHFVELSPWVVSNCLSKNIATCRMQDCAIIHTTKAEEFLKRARTIPGFAGGSFDFLSVCPPYELVSYPELYELLEGSPLIHEESIVIVEYPKKLGSMIPETLGPLVKLRDRRYGRTYLAVYGPDFDGSYS